MSTKKRRGGDALKKSTKNDGKIRVEYDKVVYTTAYKEIAATIKHDYPSIECRGKAYPLRGHKQQWIYLLYVIQFTLAILVTFAEDLVKRYEIPVDDRWLDLLRKNRYYLIPGIIMLSPVRQLLANSGAFEVYLNGTYYIQNRRLCHVLSRRFVDLLGVGHTTTPDRGGAM
ncbi:hypothetical protein DYB26_000695 [Aphanomyces astaci]|uniref:Uncharacterized protein n=1 Tax=Aphanomyces astaci TaxID=112090 RepID=A0A397FW25_APHAT|nr:hypothetical protein DYB26_000695 [Aphanomyces astaci]RHZ41799.1 hypothetical protein DYB31_002744 [Aphanomyces astaci]